MWILKTANDATDPVTFRILPGNIKTIGRSSGAEFMVDAALVSRLHCRLSAGATELQVDDLDSTNGTFLRRARIVAPEPLADGDLITIGPVELRFRAWTADKPAKTERIRRRSR